MLSAGEKRTFAQIGVLGRMGRTHLKALLPLLRLAAVPLGIFAGGFGGLVVRFAGPWWALVLLWPGHGVERGGGGTVLAGYVGKQGGV